MEQQRTRRPVQTTPIQFRARSLEEPLRVRVGTGLAMSVHTVASRDLARYYAVIDASLRRLRFTDSEASLICEALSGPLWEEPSTVMHLWAMVSDAIQIDHLASKWGVEDPDGLIDRLRTASPGELMAIADAVERFWKLSDMETGAALRAVGLVRD